MPVSCRIKTQTHSWPTAIQARFIRAVIPAARPVTLAFTLLHFGCAIPGA